jgi:hypothetical protein
MLFSNPPTSQNAFASRPARAHRIDQRPGRRAAGTAVVPGTERRQERVDLGSGRGEEPADPGSGRRRNADPSEPGSRRNPDPAGTRTGWVRACTLTARAGSAGRWMPWGARRPAGAPADGRRSAVGQGWPGSRSRRLRGHGRLAQENATAGKSRKGAKHRDIT